MGLPDHERIRQLEVRMQLSEDNMVEATRQMLLLKNAVEQTNASLKANTSGLTELIELAKNFKYGLKIFGGIERIAVFITKVTLAAGSIWAAWKFIISETLKRLFENS